MRMVRTYRNIFLIRDDSSVYSFCLKYICKGGYIEAIHQKPFSRIAVKNGGEADPRGDWHRGLADLEVCQHDTVFTHIV